ncbi:hypothetical protein, partial [Frankia sp. EI5c]|uniref:hypothetical protein n=1 Tax=Frankia sp. EI5c TaxID=683316 RepID=UPI001A7EFECC
ELIVTRNGQGMGIGRYYQKETQPTQGKLRMITENEMARPVLRRAYAKQLTVDVTSQQLEFLAGVQQRSGRTLSDVVRAAVDFWRHQVEQAG